MELLSKGESNQSEIARLFRMGKDHMLLIALLDVGFKAAIVAIID